MRKFKMPDITTVAAIAISSVCLTLAAKAETPREQAENLAFRPVIDVRYDLSAMKIAPENAVADGKTNSTEPIQAAIDYLAARDGGTVLLPAGKYLVRTLTVVDGVDLVGDGPDKTIVRSALNARALINLTGGSVVGMSLYGTSEDGSGDNWKVGRGGVGKKGTAKAAFGIIADGVTNGATIANVHASEVRYDPLYTRDCRNLKVINSRFDRAGRNVVSLVGNTDGFLFSDCYFGSLWGLYHFDIEPNDGKYVRNGLIINCVFDGSRAGEMNTDTWGAFFGFCGDRVGDGLNSRNVTVKDCTFNSIWVRIQGVFPDVKFINNTFSYGSSAFVKVRSNKVGEFRDALVRDNIFKSSSSKAQRFVVGATFTGDTIIEGNHPPEADQIPITAKSQDIRWEEVHPITQKDAEETGAQEVFGENQVVTMPLRGHRFRFSDGRVFPNVKEDIGADVIMHIDPLLTIGDAGLMSLGKGKLDTFETAPVDGYERRMFGASAGDICAVRTRQGRYVLMEIMAFSTKQIQFRYRFVKTAK